MYRYTSFLGLMSLGLQVAHAMPQPASVAPSAAPTQSITAQQMEDAFPPRNPANTTNWYGTSLYGWDGCDDISPLIKGWIKEAYTDANKLVNYDGVKANIDWDSAAALEFLGPSAYNKNQQSQIQAVFANVATVKEGSALWTPNWIRARCDDRAKRCSENCPTTAEDEDKAVVVAYARNPKETGEKYPDINFCPPFYGLRNLGNAIAYGSGFSNVKMKSLLTNYEGRADTFLHELLHLDLAANSKNGNPNPQIRDLKIKFTYGDGPKDGTSSGWTKAYGPKLAKILARFQPLGTVSKQTGYFVQRNDDNLVSFALANYVQKQIKSYPFLPVIYDKINDAPMLPPAREASNPNVLFTASGTDPATFLNFTTDINNTTQLIDDSGCPTVLTTSSNDTDVEIGPPIPSDAYPEFYLSQRKTWLQSLIAADMPWCEHGADPDSHRLPASYCMCGPNGGIYYSVAVGSEPCPYTAAPGPTVTWTTMGATMTRPLATGSTSTTTATSACNPYWCGAPFCEGCGP